MKTYDPHFIFVNLAYDIDRMAKDGTNSKAILNHIKRKINFLENPPVGSKINW